ncbi:unnamed protein product, partial [marine sediment metagenome]
LPLTFTDEADYDKIGQGDELKIVDVPEALRKDNTLAVRNLTRGSEFTAQHSLSPRQVEMILAGGLLNYVKNPG